MPNALLPGICVLATRKTILETAPPAIDKSETPNRVRHIYVIGVSSDDGANEVQEHEHFRKRRKVLQVSMGQADFGFPVVVASIVRGLPSECVGPSRRASPGAAPPEATIHTAESRA